MERIPTRRKANEHRDFAAMEAHEKIARILLGLGDTLETAGIQLKEAVSELVDYQFGLSEKVFTILKWSKRNSEKLGEYEVAKRGENDPNAFNHAYNILKVNSATIKSHFSSKEWNYYYWIFENAPDLIFRKRRGKNDSKGND